MLVKIPLHYYGSKTDTVDWESLGIEKPEEDDLEMKEFETWIDPDSVTWVEPNIAGGGGSYIHVNGFEKEWSSPLSPDQLAKLVNEALI